MKYWYPYIEPPHFPHFRIPLLATEVPGAIIAGAVLLSLTVLAGLGASMVLMYILLRLIFVPYLIVVRGVNATDAFRESWIIAKDYGVFRIGWILGWAGLVGMSGMILCFIGYFFTWPIFYGTVGSLYHEVFVENPVAALPVQPESPVADDAPVPDAPLEP